MQNNIHHQNNSISKMTAGQPRWLLGWCALMYILACVAALPQPALGETLSASGVMKRSIERYTGDTQTSTVVLTLIDQKNRQRARNLKMISIEKDNVEKSLFFFLSPADVKGTAYMNFDWDNESKADDSWMYLPALQKIKRLASSEQSGSFMGSDFSYADINGLEYEDFSYQMIKDSEKVEGIDCWVIKATPKNESVVEKTGYQEMSTWVRKDNFFQVKSIINLNEGKRIKYFSAKDIEEVQGVWTARTLQMVTTRNNKVEHSSVFKTVDIVYNKNVDEGLFDTQVMQRGI